MLLVKGYPIAVVDVLNIIPIMPLALESKIVLLFFIQLLHINELNGASSFS